MAAWKKVIIIGASGTVGTPILHALLHQSNLDITILKRSESPSYFLRDDRITIIENDFTFEGFRTAFAGHDVIINATAIPVLQLQTTMIDAAISAKVPRFVLNEYATSPNLVDALPELEQFRTVKKDIYDYAQIKAAESQGSFTWSALATGNILDLSLLRYPQFGIDIHKKKAQLVDDGRTLFSATTLADIGKAVCGLINRPLETANKFLHVRSVETCQYDLVQALQEQTDSAWQIKYEQAEKLYTDGKIEFARGQRSGLASLMRVQLFAKSGQGRGVIISRELSDNALLGVEEKHVADVVADVLSRFASSNSDSLMTR